MCGISGVYGYHATFKTALLTLAQLERGIQGCGVAYMCSRKIKVIKEPVHPVTFFEHNYRKLDNNSRIAIGHNRMPSQGEVTYVNTHPFLSCHREFALVHNGHMFNHKVREKLKKEGHKIRGKTDSEVICHLLEELYLEKDDMIEALNGLYEHDFSGAILLLTSKGVIYGLKDSLFPLYVAQSGKEIYIASSKDAINTMKGRDMKARALKPWQILEVRKGELKIHKAVHKERLIISKKKGKYTVYRWFPQYIADTF